MYGFRREGFEKMIKKLKTKVVCAISGGVDSAVAAALLKETNGFEVIGVFMKLFSESKSGRFSSGAEERARAVAKKLKIPFYTFDFRKEFKKKIINGFLEGHRKGLTPNPCIVCNKKIKFGLLLEKAHELKADFVATGHYASIMEGKEKIRLVKAKDKDKDQSYFLYQFSQNQLKHILFPIGGYRKIEVKKMAKKLKIPLFGASESQEICFIKTTANDFLKQHLKRRPGKIVNVRTGKTIGEHQGLWFYTIGQRKGIRLGEGPFYVLDKDLKKNLLIVTKKERDLYKKEVFLKNINWISGKSPRLPTKVKAKIRYRHEPAEAVITKRRGQKYKLQFKKGQRAATLGQSAVFYKRDEVLGGGIIC